MDTPSKATLAALRLSLVRGVGTHISKKLMDACGSVANIWNCTVDDWAAIPGVGPKLIEMLQTPHSDEIQKIIDQCHQHQIQMIGFDDEAYPDLLRATDDAPLVLFARGEARTLSHPHMLAIVGARKASQESRLIGRRWSHYFSEHDIVVVSGMAYGIDTSAHGGALQGPTPTIAVLGCGLAALQQRQIAQVAAIIEHGGCVISEYLPLQSARPEHFPQRNRMIAGLSHATLVIEADIRSGSLITARLANEYGRNVFAVPGSVLQGGHAGCHQLIRDGAYLTDSSEELLQQLGWHQCSYPKTASSGDNPEESAVIQALQHDILHLDALSEACGLTLPELSPILLALELRGVIERLPGSRYTLGG